jgi:hypothetical protein
LGLFSRKPKITHGHLRVFATPDGRLTGVEVKEGLEPREVQPSVERVLTELSRMAEERHREEVEARIKATRKKAGILDKLSGKAKDRLEAAHAKMPTELFDGRAGAVGITIDGNLGFVRAVVDDGCTASEAFGLIKRATEAAEEKALAAWEQEVLGASEAASADEEATEESDT